MKYDVRVFCNNIKNLRKTKELSKREMAKLLGISVYSLNLIEKGKLPSRLSVSILYNLYDVLGVTADEMFNKK